MSETETQTERCSKKWYECNGSAARIKQCGHTGVMNEQARWWCKQHAPSTLAESRQQTDRKVARMNLDRDIHAIEAQIVEAVLSLRDSALTPELGDLRYHLLELREKRETQ